MQKADIAPPSSDFEYIGYISLSDNSTSNFQSRELQNISISPRIGSYVKLKFGDPYSNELNNKNQVALIAVNILGTILTNHEMEDKRVELKNAIFHSTPETLTTHFYDDLSFTMYVDEIIADVIRTMNARKTNAVKGNTFY